MRRACTDLHRSLSRVLRCVLLGLALRTCQLRLGMLHRRPLAHMR